MAINGGKHESVAGFEHFVAPEPLENVAEAGAQRGGIGAFRDDGHFVGAGKFGGS